MALLPHGRTTGRALCRSSCPCSGQKPSIVVVVVVVVVVVSPHFRCFLYVCQANSRASGAAAESTITNVSGRSAAAPPRLAARGKRNYLYPRHAATGLRAANSAAQQNVLVYNVCPPCGGICSRHVGVSTSLKKPHDAYAATYNSLRYRASKTPSD